MKTTVTPLQPFVRARRAGCPLIAISTADPAATVKKCRAALNGKAQSTPVFVWDVVRGIMPDLTAETDSAANEATKRVWEALNLNPDGQPGPVLSDPVQCLAALVQSADKLTVQHPDDADRKIGSLVFMVHANRWLEDYAAMQAVWNCRLVFEPLGACLVLLGPSIKLPAELKNDVVLINEPLPDHPELTGILDDLADDVGMSQDKITEKDRIVDTVSGTSAFGARQILAMGLTKDGFDQDTLWERKVKMIEQTPGLSVWRGSSSFQAIGGLDGLKEYCRDILTSGNTPVGAVVFVDEIEKAMAGATGGDMSGTSQDQMGAVLRVMQDRNYTGIIEVGHAGCGKSEIAKACGAIARCPTISLDLGAMKGSLVGQSEQQIRAALDVIEAVSGGSAFWIATCNKIASLPPELRRRFTLGTYFVDLPTKEEREAIWPIWIAKFGLKTRQALPACDGWTGAEIRAACDIAHRTGRTLTEASRRVVPIIRSNPEAVESLRALAHNRFIDARTGEVYQQEKQQPQQQTTGRRIEL